MAAIGRWIYRLGECDSRLKLWYCNLHNWNPREHALFSCSGDQRGLCLGLFFHSNCNCFIYYRWRHCNGSSTHGLFWWDDYLVLNGKYGYHPVAAFGERVYGLGNCHGRVRSDHSQLHHSCSDDYDVLPRSGEQRCLYPS